MRKDTGSPQLRSCPPPPKDASLNCCSACPVSTARPSAWSTQKQQTLSLSFAGAHPPHGCHGAHGARLHELHADIVRLLCNRPVAETQSIHADSSCGQQALHYTACLQRCEHLAASSTARAHGEATARMHLRLPSLLSRLLQTEGRAE